MYNIYYVIAEWECGGGLPNSLQYFIGFINNWQSVPSSVRRHF